MTAERAPIPVLLVTGTGKSTVAAEINDTLAALNVPNAAVDLDALVWQWPSRVTLMAHLTGIGGAARQGKKLAGYEGPGRCQPFWRTRGLAEPEAPLEPTAQMAEEPGSAETASRSLGTPLSGLATVLHEVPFQFRVRVCAPVPADGVS